MKSGKNQQNVLQTEDDRIHWKGHVREIVCFLDIFLHQLILYISHLGG